MTLGAELGWDQLSSDFIVVNSADTRAQDEVKGPSGLWRSLAMNLNEEINIDLWQAVESKYEGKLYAEAILDAIKSLSHLIREKSNADGDGASLIGQAFGGNSPKVMLNRMQTTSEIDEQKGFEQLLRGIYGGIRNPRTHEIYVDTKESADAVILFINFLYLRISSTQSFFELESFKKRVFDKLFAERDDYAELIVSEIPYDEIENTAVAILNERDKGDSRKLQYFFRATFNRAERDQTERIVKAISNELRAAQSEHEIVDVIAYLQGELWTLVDEDVKIRTETSMIESVKQGIQDAYEEKLQAGHLGAWASTRGEYFKLRRELAAALIDLLRQSWYTQNYVGEIFFFYLPSIIKDNDQIQRCCSNLAYAALSNQARRVRDKLEDHFDRLPKTWQQLILEYGLRYRDEDPDYYQKLTNAYLPF